jgi:hypothetical protein
LRTIGSFIAKLSRRALAVPKLFLCVKTYTFAYKNYTIAQQLCSALLKYRQIIAALTINTNMRVFKNTIHPNELGCFTPFNSPQSALG